MNAQDLYRAGKLGEAVAQQTEEVKKNPTDLGRRCFLAELLCLSGNLDRADAQLETISKMQQPPSPAIGLMRQLVRAEKTRQEVHFDGRAPEILVPLPPYAGLSLEAATALRAGDVASAARLAMEAEEQRPHLHGTCDGEPFDDFRDLDDLTAGFFEVLTSTGKYFWVPFESVISVEPDAPATPLDLLWRPVQMSVRGGPEGKVFLAAVYSGRGAGLDDAARLGRRTDWTQASQDGPVRGVGLRTFLVGEDTRSLFELGALAFEELEA
jgi:type VI secretion system protein ImpE